MVPLTVACLPVAGPQNPYQHLMMEGLSQDGQLKAFNGIHDKFFGIIRTVIKYRPDYLHFDWIISYYYRRWRWLTYLSVLTFCAQIVLARWLGVKVVWTLHNILPHDLGHPQPHRFCQRFLARRCAWIRVFAPGTIPAAAAELRVPESTFRGMPEGSYVRVYPNQVSRQEARAYLHLPVQGRVLLYVGLIKPYKGVLELIQAFKKRPLADTYLLMAGKIMDQAYGEQIKKELAPGMVLNDGFVPEKELQYYFNAADAVVLPFQKIENSGSILLAMGFAKTIVTPRRGVVAERLKQQDEWLYDTPEEFEEVLYQLTRTPASTLQETGNRNFAALEHYSWQDFASLFL